MNGFNLSTWALGHRSFVWYLMLLIVVAGGLSYTRLGREEDPAFTIKAMVVSASWPGATVVDMTNQVTDRIERKLQELDTLDFTKSYTISGQTTIFVNLKDDTPASRVKDIWVDVRNKVNDIRGDLPSSVQGVYFNDQFGDVFGNIYAFTADGLSFRELRDYAEYARSQILKIPGAGKVEFLGTQDEVIFLNFSTRHVAGLGLDQQAVLKSLQEQNAVAPSGVIQAGPEQVTLRVSGHFKSVASLEAVNLRVGDRFFRLSDITTITRGYVDPPQPMFRYNGQPAIGIAIGMKANGNILQFGQDLRARMREIVGTLPIGVGVHLVSNQPAVVEEAVGGFTKALFEAVAIVLVVSFLSLGLRAGLVVAIAIPLVLAATFVFMEYSGITLQRISLGALIIALGLLVDDAMISVEMMVARREAGDSLEKAATFAYTSTAFPMLTGTLVTVAGFVPIGLNGSSAGEYTFTLFAVIAAALLISWVVAVLFTPLLGITMLPRTAKTEAEKPSRLKTRFRPLLLWAMRRRWITIAATLALFALSLFGMNYVQNQFFPSADRPELLVDMTLPQSASIAATKDAMDRFEKSLVGDPDIVRRSSYVGRGAVRFYLPLDEQLNNAFFGQFVIVTKDFDARQRVAVRLKKVLRDSFVGIDGFVHPLDLGPPVGRPIQYRLSGPDIQGVRGLALQFADLMGANPNVGGIVYDWNEPGMVLRVEVDQNRARQFGVSSQDIATVLNNVVGGSSVTQVYDSIYIVNVVARADKAEREAVETFQGLQIAGRDGQPVPLPAIANIEFQIEQPIVWRRNRQPTVTLQAPVISELQPATVVQQLKPAVAKFVAALPVGYSVEIGGTVEESGKGERPIAAVIPLMLFLMATVLMLQLQSFQKLFLVVSVAPLGLIGVVAALLISDQPLGFVAILGVLALIGIIIRNTVILVTQVDEFRAEGLGPWEAVIEATMHRMRPILLTAAAASLGMIPIAREVFWGPMAFAMIGGIVVATLLTLLFLPALYVAWYRLKEPLPEASR
ncbi:Multidrug efflux pump subunit AcrB [Rhodospirillales bacterium URHD0017]|nr:Multidrug efflux pump subunit AcrB [Rhodospirillales bacterium URHD0017]